MGRSRFFRDVCGMGKEVNKRSWRSPGRRPAHNTSSTWTLISGGRLRLNKMIGHVVDETPSNGENPSVDIDNVRKSICT